VRTAGDPAAVTGSVRAAVRAVDPALPVASVRTMDQIVGAWSAERRLNTVVLAALGALALVLAVVGIYGVIAYMVAQRTREMGVRLALGARPADVLRLVVRQGAALAGAGIAVGLAGAWEATRSMRSMLYSVSATDPATFVGVALVLAAAALAASFIPARRATRVDPVVALRSE
jgi:putative ABC transport system permease protein